MVPVIETPLLPSSSQCSGQRRGSPFQPPPRQWPTSASSPGSLFSAASTRDAHDKALKLGQQMFPLPDFMAAVTYATDPQLPPPIHGPQDVEGPGEICPAIVQRLRAVKLLLRRGRLPPAEDASLTSLVGPHKYSNWAIPGRLCVGTFPCLEVWRREGSDAYRRDLATICDAGVTLFACLDGSPYRVTQGSGGKARKPCYLVDVPPWWHGEARVFPTADGMPFDWETLTECLEAVGEHLSEKVRGGCYVHCFGGHGRAGIVIACLLGLAYDLPSHRALLATQRAHDARVDPAWPLAVVQPSPQTMHQRNQVVKLLEAVQRGIVAIQKPSVARSFRKGCF